MNASSYDGGFALKTPEISELNSINTCCWQVHQIKKYISLFLMPHDSHLTFPEFAVTLRMFLLDCVNRRDDKKCPKLTECFRPNHR